MTKPALIAPNPSSRDQVGGFKIPDGFPEDHREELENWMKLPPIRDKRLKLIKDQYEGGQAAIDGYIENPNPEEISTKVWNNKKKLATPVNYCVPVERCYTSIVTGGNIKREVKAAPGEELIRTWLDVDYIDTFSLLATNANVYGTAVLVPVYDPEEKYLSGWLPAPESTHIITDRRNKRKVLAIVERTKTCLKFHAVWGEGFLSKDDSEFVPRNYGDYLPCAIAYGIKTNDVYGKSVVSSAADWSIRSTATAFNIALLSRQETWSLLVRSGDHAELLAAQETDPSVGNTSGSGLMDLPPGWDAKFISPNPKLTQSLEVLREHRAICATESSVPLDVLDNSMSANTSGQSAEAARVRALALSQMAKKLVPQWIKTDKDALVAAAAVVDYHLTSEAPLREQDVRNRCDIAVTNSPQVMPISPNEATQNIIAQLVTGLVSPEEAVGELRPHKTQQAIEEQAAVCRELMEKRGAQQLEQDALKTSALARGSDGQSSAA